MADCAVLGTKCDMPAHNRRVADSKARVVVIVVFDDVTMLDVAGAGEVFAEANRYGADYELKIASLDGRDVRTSIGTRLGVTDAISSIESADTVVTGDSAATLTVAYTPPVITR